MPGSLSEKHTFYANPMKKNHFRGAMAAAILISMIMPAELQADSIPPATPRNVVPDAWLYSPDHLQTSPEKDTWWRNFGDTTLNHLIDKAVANNYNVAAALKRIEMARQQTASAKAGYYPTFSLSAGWNKDQQSGALSKPVGPSVRSDYFSAGINMNWEIDVFGRIRSKVKAGKAAVEVSRAEYDALLVSLCAELAKDYVQLRVYQAEYEVAKTHLVSQEKILRITEARLEAGIGDALEVAQARLVLYSTKASIPRIESGIRTTANSIAVLTGEYPSALAAGLLKPGPLPVDFGMPSIGVPADLIRRRPDIVEAEAEMARYAALVGVAKKDFLPMLSLSGSIGTSAHKINNLFGSHSLDYSIAPTLSWTIFDGLARNHNLTEARLQLEASADSYNLTVLNAIEEVENAISLYNASLSECALLEDVIEQSRKSLELSLDLYKQGLSAFSNVVDAQESYLSNQNSLVESKGSVLTSLVALYQALGGGF